MATEREVLEFVIVPPFEKRTSISASKERMEGYLNNRFRGYSFKVAAFAPVGDEGQFCVLPVMNYAGDDGRSYMCVPPQSWFLAEIAEACKEFDQKGFKSFAA